jgi:hypothetical protein
MMCRRIASCDPPPRPTARSGGSGHPREFDDAERLVLGLLLLAVVSAATRTSSSPGSPGIFSETTPADDTLATSSALASLASDYPPADLSEAAIVRLRSRAEHAAPGGLLADGCNSGLFADPVFDGGFFWPA